MSQKSVENVLGRLITDAAFRREFFATPATLCHANDFDLTPSELSALLRLSESAAQNLAQALDPRIVRTMTPDPLSNTKAAVRMRHAPLVSVIRKRPPRSATRGQRSVR